MILNIFGVIKMKIFCFDREECGYFYYLTDEDYKEIDFSKKFMTCPCCTSIAAIVPDHFVLDLTKNDYFDILTTVEKALKSNDDDIS